MEEEQKIVDDVTVFDSGMFVTVRLLFGDTVFDVPISVGAAQSLAVDLNNIFALRHRAIKDAEKIAGKSSKDIRREIPDPPLTA